MAIVFNLVLNLDHEVETTDSTDLTDLTLIFYHSIRSDSIHSDFFIILFILILFILILIMIIQFQNGENTYKANLSKPIDISIPLIFNNLDNPNAWYCPSPEAEPQRFSDFNIAVENGAAVNSMGVRLFPHGNGTHTEGVGHLMNQSNWVTVNQALRTFHCLARLISVFPTRTSEGNSVILKTQIEKALGHDEPFDALIVRTLPNHDLKPKMQWSGTNPAFFEDEALSFVAQMGIKHLLTDLPSVDKEDDGGKVAGHRAFWCYDGENLPAGRQGTERVRFDATITEMIYIPSTVRRFVSAQLANSAF